MSGIRLHNYREGDRSEYLANYLLSGIGLVTAVPRQEDIGFDFYCQLADRESGKLSFGYPFVIQIKSSIDDRITYGNSDHKKWDVESIRWLFRLEIPFFIGVINKKELRLDIYNTSPLSFIYFENPNSSIVEFKLHSGLGCTKIGRPARQQLSDWNPDKGDGFRYIVDLGNPIVSISNDDIYNNEVLKNKKDMLRNIVFLEQENYLFRKLKVPFFRWTLGIETNIEIKLVWGHLTPENFEFGKFYGSTLAQSLISIAINFKNKGKDVEAFELRAVLRRIRNVPPEIKDKYPELFS